MKDISEEFVEELLSCKLSEEGSFYQEFSSEVTIKSGPTYKSFEYVLGKDRGWCEKLLTRLKADKNQGNRHGMLGELRAYSDLLRLPGLKVESNTGKKGPDFDLKDGKDTIVAKVEVYTQCVKKNCTRPGDGAPGCIRENVVTPLIDWSNITKRFKEEDVSEMKATTGAIAATKRDEHQASTVVPTILYVDLTLIDYIDTEWALPLIKHGEYISTGALWLKCYGGCGMPMLDAVNPFVEPLTYEGVDECGLFANAVPSKYAGVLFRTYEKDRNRPLVFFENPKSVVKVSDLFLYALLGLEKLNFERSIMRVGGNDLGPLVAQYNQMSIALCDLVNRVKNSMMN